jgi:arginyl-tRNA synthetase
MIEYSQPNTHKAFHVGHMRNCALGDSLVRLYEQVGHEVVAVNYFGDEGAHVAKCLWFLKKRLTEMNQTEKEALDAIPVDKRGEWLGDCYSKAVELLEPKNYTKYPFPSVVAGKVLSINKHPNEKAPANWHVCTIDYGAADGSVATVVCGGSGYEVNDVVAYLPVGAKLNIKMGVIGVADKMGVGSHGVMLAERELGLEGEDDDDAGAAAAHQKAGKEEEKKDAKAVASAGKKAGKGKDGKDGKDSAAAAAAAAEHNQIFKLPPSTKPGTILPEVGRIAGSGVPDSVPVMEFLGKMKSEVSAVLQGLEHGDKELCALWDKTKQWSLDEFKRIYSWLDCRFDHDFTESECSVPSQQIVKEWTEKQYLVKKDGAMVMDLTAHNLGCCVLLKSDGTGLYATKDLALAKRKFEQFKVDKSIYVVDAAQTYHFQQVFKTLELCGYPQAQKCVHIPYGLVVLPEGKMSSRKGTVIFFSTLKEMLRETIMENFLKKHQGDWSEEEIQNALRAISVATIKYGMLSHDADRNIVFELSSWAQSQGNTGPYLLYAYARMCAIANKVKIPDGVTPKIDFNHLDHPSERTILLQIHRFWDVIQVCVASNNPVGLCAYLFELCQKFSVFYENVRLSQIQDNDVLYTKLAFLKAVSAVLRKGLMLLGIKVVERM